MIFWDRFGYAKGRNNVVHHMRYIVQVTCYGQDGVGDINDIWKVEIVNGEPGEHIKAVNSKFRLIHVQKGEGEREWLRLHVTKQIEGFVVF